MSASGLAGKRRDGPLARPRGEPELDRRRRVGGALLDILASQRLQPAGDDGGRVRVLSAASVRGLRMPYVFLAGLGEKSFPSPQREDRLYSEAECQRLIEQGLPLGTRAAAQQRGNAAVLRGRHPGDAAARG